MPHSLGTIKIGVNKSAAQRHSEGGWASRHPPYAKGDVLNETQVVACQRAKVADFPDGFLKQSHIEHLEQNQNISSCCRHPENHEVEARKSHPDEPSPDIYIFHCQCGKSHRFFCVGVTDERPVWDADERHDKRYRKHA